MNAPATAKLAQYKAHMHRLLGELATIRPQDPGYQKKLSLLGERIDHPPRQAPASDADASTTLPAAGWGAAWQRQKARWRRAGGGWLMGLRGALAGRPVARGAGLQAARYTAWQRNTADDGADTVPAHTAPRGESFAEVHLGPDRQYRGMLYEPPSRRAGPAPLLVMLHGCRQRAEDFAAATRMNEAAADAGVVVLYPEQSAALHPLRCWNWYALQDRSHQAGDGARIAAMTRQVMREHDIDAARVYVAGMSAGGAMAAVLARDYPELYAALGVHSGVPAGLAHDLPAAMQLMSSGPAASPNGGSSPDDEPRRTAVPSIVFHGDADTTVHPANGHALHAVAQPLRRTPGTAGPLQATTVAEDGQRSFTRSVELGPDGRSHSELWLVHGAGHAWSGGSAAQPHTDTSGPAASREMLRFFLSQRPHAPVSLS